GQLVAAGSLQVLEIGLGARPAQLVLLLPLAQRGMRRASLLDRLLAGQQETALVGQPGVRRLVARRGLGTRLERRLALLLGARLLSADLGDAIVPLVDLAAPPGDRSLEIPHHLAQAVPLARQGLPALLGRRQDRPRLGRLAAHAVQLGAQRQELGPLRLDFLLDRAALVLELREIPRERRLLPAPRGDIALQPRPLARQERQGAVDPVRLRAGLLQLQIALERQSRLILHGQRRDSQALLP